MKTIHFLIMSFFCMDQYIDAQTPAENKKVIIRYIEEVTNQRKLNVLDEVFAERFLRHDLIDSSENYVTVAQQKKNLQGLFTAFPDIHYTIGDIIAEGDKVFLRASFTGTHLGKFWGQEPTGNRIKYLSEIFFFRLEKGKVVERWVHFDLYNIHKAIGKKDL